MRESKQFSLAEPEAPPRSVEVMASRILDVICVVYKESLPSVTRYDAEAAIVILGRDHCESFRSSRLSNGTRATKPVKTWLKQWLARTTTLDERWAEFCKQFEAQFPSATPRTYTGYLYTGYFRAREMSAGCAVSCKYCQNNPVRTPENIPKECQRSDARQYGCIRSGVDDGTCFGSHNSNASNGVMVDTSPGMYVFIVVNNHSKSVVGRCILRPTSESTFFIQNGYTATQGKNLSWFTPYLHEYFGVPLAVEPYLFPQAAIGKYENHTNFPLPLYTNDRKGIRYTAPQEIFSSEEISTALTCSCGEVHPRDQFLHFIDSYNHRAFCNSPTCATYAASVYKSITTCPTCGIRHSATSTTDLRCSRCRQFYCHSCQQTFSEHDTNSYQYTDEQVSRSPYQEVLRDHTIFDPTQTLCEDCFRTLIEHPPTAPPLATSIRTSPTQLRRIFRREFNNYLLEA